MKAFYPAVAALLFTAGCAGPVQKQQQAAVDNLSPCEKIQGLMAAYDNQFDGLKLTRTQSKFMDSWQAKYHLVGDSCQISALNNTTYAYSCQNAYSDKESALAVHQQAVEFTRQCLGEGWFEQQKESETSLRTTFVLDESSANVSIHTGKSLSRSTPWTTSYDIGKTKK
ncbi:hypothetical protein AAEU32_11905 [Pseudoalteromonas sp. SSDWG2]|uniref:hypothetical protein n=1 Tax=Pseudoalteromonas sp. SSDWG2 TaxID=3139391 RepID=UPI003BA90397